MSMNDEITCGTKTRPLFQKQQHGNAFFICTFVGHGRAILPYNMRVVIEGFEALSF